MSASRVTSQRRPMAARPSAWTSWATLPAFASCRSGTAIFAPSAQAEHDPPTDPGTAPGHHRHLPGELHGITLPHRVPEMTEVGLASAAALDANAVIQTDTVGRW